MTEVVRGAVGHIQKNEWISFLSAIWSLHTKPADGRILPLAPINIQK